MGTFDVQEAERRRESPAGMHFYGLYRECPRKWYLKYPCGLRPKQVSPALMLGGALHEALEVYYEDFSLMRAQKIFREALADRKPNYQDSMKFLDDFNRGPVMLETFHREVGLKDKESYEVIELEHEYQVPIGPPESKFLFTVRPDKVLKRRTTKVIYPVEVKSTSYSVSAAASSAERSDQVTGYLWALNKMHPEWQLGGCLIDTIYNKKSVFEAKRMETPAMRSKHELATFEMGLYGTIVEVTQKYKSLENYPWPLLFPQVRAACSHWGCEYMGVCFTNMQPGEIPPGFQHDDWRGELSQAFRKTQSFKLDSITYGKEPV
jgi:hypothetical protein